MVAGLMAVLTSKAPTAKAAPTASRPSAHTNSTITARPIAQRPPPAADSSATSRHKLPPPWMEAWSQTYQQKYYFNPQTGEKRWSMDRTEAQARADATVSGSVAS
eukprot:4379901-Prymnesium_polylepis.1